MDKTSRTPSDAYSPLTLAFVGDGVYDLLVREYFARQANRPVLTESEQAVYKRGRNAAPKCTPKNGTVADYHSATGLECLFGYLHINGEKERIAELFGMIVDLAQKS